MYLSYELHHYLHVFVLRTASLPSRLSLAHYKTTFRDVKFKMVLLTERGRTRAESRWPMKLLYFTLGNATTDRNVHGTMWSRYSMRNYGRVM